jgi:hypothetical protein
LPNKGYTKSGSVVERSTKSGNQVNCDKSGTAGRTPFDATALCTSLRRSFPVAPCTPRSPFPSRTPCVRRTTPHVVRRHAAPIMTLVGACVGAQGFPTC